MITVYKRVNILKILFVTKQSAVETVEDQEARTNKNEYCCIRGACHRSYHLLIDRKPY